MPRERTYPRAVPNPEEPVASKSSVKETAINAAVWTLSAAVVLGVGTWIWKRAKRTVIKENDSAPQQAMPHMANAYLANNPWAAMQQMPMQMGNGMPMMIPMAMPASMPPMPGTAPSYVDSMPAALQMQPNIGGDGPRRRKANSSGPPSWFRDFENQQNQRFASLERKLEDSYEEEDDLEE